ncbi:MAG: hypothetical protein MUF84_07375 [Anaerolineae bacterium]|jgi:hypothetical protein|nr:hypothetical protein [Anaerolineae bacterium]
MTKERKKTPWFLWPFVALWDLITWILQLTGRIVAATLGLVIVIAGVLLTVTVVGAIVGIPLIIFGFLLMVRSIF